MIDIADYRARSIKKSAASTVATIVVNARAPIVPADGFNAIAIYFRITEWRFLQRFIRYGVSSRGRKKPMTHFRFHQKLF